MAITRETVARLAEMTRIGLADSELEALTADMGAILDHISLLQSIDTSTVSIDDGPASLHDVLRLDEVTSSIRGEDALLNAPECHEGFFVVPAVFGET